MGEGIRCGRAKAGEAELRTEPRLGGTMGALGKVGDGAANIRRRGAVGRGVACETEDKRCGEVPCL